MAELARDLFDTRMDPVAEVDRLLGSEGLPRISEHEVEHECKKEGRKDQP